MNKKGLSLLEILIASILLALVMIGMANLFIVGKRYVLHSRSRMSGGELGKLFLDPLQMQVHQGNWNSNCLGSGNCTAGSQTLDGIQYNATYTITNVTNATRRVAVNITWNENPP